jgi:TonB family protein
VSLAIEMTLRSSLVLAVGLVAVLAMRRHPAALRHWILAAALAFAAAQPLVNRVVPQWRIPALTWTRMTTESTAAGRVETSVEFEAPVEVVIRPVEGLSWAQVAFGVWLSGVIVSLLVLGTGTAWMIRLGSRAIAAGAAWHEPGEQIRLQLGLRRPIRIVITDHPAMLVTWGLIRPIILLPAGAAAWPAERIRLVLAHEIAHLVRHDWLIQLLAEGLRSLHWFNPLFWTACAQLRRDSEHACDDVVIGSGIGGASYAAHLVDLARSFSVHGRTWLPAPSIARPSTLERRVRAMLNPHTDRRPVSTMRRLLLTLGLLAIALPIAAASQPISGSSGRIVDPSGLPLPDAAIRLTAVNTDASFEARTDATGSFQLPDLPAGEYLLSARYPGFSSRRQRIQINGNVTITLQMQVGKLSETVTVRGGGAPEPVARTVTTAVAGAAPACGSTPVGGNLKPPKKLRDVRPLFKQSWVEANQQGNVLLEATIGADGRVKNLEIVSPSHPEMEDEAMAAVSQWEFTPTYLNCQPVEVRMFVTVSFQLER